MLLQLPGERFTRAIRILEEKEGPQRAKQRSRRPFERAMGAVHNARYSFNPQAPGLAPSALSLAKLYYFNFSEGRLTAAKATTALPGGPQRLSGPTRS